MELKTLKDVAMFLTEVKGHKETFIRDSKGHGKVMNFLAARSNTTPSGLTNEIKTEIETLNKAIAILEKESE